MACIACKTVPKLLTNLLVDEEIRLKFTELTGIVILQNLFFCGKCVRKLENAIDFRRKCRAYYKETYEDYIDRQDPQNNTTIESSRSEQGTEEFYVYDPLNEQIEYLEEDRSEHGDGMMQECEEEYKPEFFEEHVECQEEPIQIEEESRPILLVEVKQEQSSALTVKSIRKRNSYTSAQKLEIVKLAEIIGNRKAAREYGTDESNVRKWRSAKEMLIVIDRDRGLKRKSNLHWPQLDSALKRWVQQKMDEGAILKPMDIKKKSIELANELNIENFYGTSSYIFKFMDRYNIPSSRVKNPIAKKRREHPQPHKDQIEQEQIE